MNNSRSWSGAWSSAKFVLFVSFFLCFGSCDLGRSGTFDLVILHTNDIHGRTRPVVHKGPDGSVNKYGGLAALAGEIRKQRKAARANGKHVLVLDAGDVFSGTIEAQTTGGAVVADYFNLAKYDAVTLGNHEYDNGQKTLKRFSQRLDGPKFLAANAFSAETNEIVPWYSESVNYNFEGVPIQIIGLVTSNIRNQTLPANLVGHEFEREEKTLKRELAERQLHEKGRAVTLLLTHIGLNRDIELANQFPVLDAIIGGHSHTRVDKPERHGPGKTVVCQAWCNSMALGKLTLRVDRRSRRVVGYHAELIRVKPERAAGAKDVTEVIEANAKKVRKLTGMDKIYGYAAKRFYLIGGKRRSSPLGNILTDVMRDIAGTQVAFQNKPGIRAPLNKGNIIGSELFDISPFGNTIVKMTLTGAQLRNLIAASLDSDYAYLEMSGMKVLCDSRKPAGKKVVSIAVAGKPLVDDQVYTVATNNFLAGGGDGCVVFKQGKKRQDTKVKLREAFMQHIETNKVIKPNYDYRLNDQALIEADSQNK